MLKTTITLIILCLYCSCTNKKIVEEARSLYEMGKQQEEAEHPDSAIINYQSALGLLENSHEYALLGEINNQIGDVLQEHRLYVEATKFHNDAYHYGIKLKDKSIASKSLREIGKNFLFNCKGDTLSWSSQDSAFVYFSKALQLVNQVDDKVEVSCIYNNLSGLYGDYGNYEKSMEYSQKAIQASNNERILYHNYHSRGVLYVALQQYDSALYYFKLSLPSKSLFTQCASYDYMYQITLATGSPDSVYYLKQYIRLNEVINQANRTPELSAAMLQQRLKNAIEKKTNEFYLIAFISLFVIGFIGLFYYYRLKLKNKNVDQQTVSCGEKKEIIKKEKKSSSKNFNVFRKYSKNQSIDAEKIRLQREKEEDEILRQLCSIGDQCISRFKQNENYCEVKRKMAENSSIANWEIENLSEEIKHEFRLWSKCLNNYVNLSESDYLFCYYLLCGFSYKECSMLFTLPEGTIRTRKSRIKNKLHSFFLKENLFLYIFSLQK